MNYNFLIKYGVVTNGAIHLLFLLYLVISALLCYDVFYHRFLGQL